MIFDARSVAAILVSVSMLILMFWTTRRNRHQLETRLGELSRQSLLYSGNARLRIFAPPSIASIPLRGRDSVGSSIERRTASGPTSRSGGCVLESPLKQ